MADKNTGIFAALGIGAAAIIGFILTRQQPVPVNPPVIIPPVVQPPVVEPPTSEPVDESPTDIPVPVTYSLVLIPKQEGDQTYTFTGNLTGNGIAATSDTDVLLSDNGVQVGNLGRAWNGQTYPFSLIVQPGDHNYTISTTIKGQTIQSEIINLNIIQDYFRIRIIGSDGSAVSGATGTLEVWTKDSVINRTAFVTSADGSYAYPIPVGHRCVDVDTVRTNIKVNAGSGVYELIKIGGFNACTSTDIKVRRTNDPIAISVTNSILRGQIINVQASGFRPNDVIEVGGTIMQYRYVGSSIYGYYYTYNHVIADQNGNISFSLKTSPSGQTATSVEPAGSYTVILTGIGFSQTGDLSELLSSPGGSVSASITVTKPYPTVTLSSTSIQSLQYVTLKAVGLAANAGYSYYVSTHANGSDIPFQYPNGQLYTDSNGELTASIYFPRGYQGGINANGAYYFILSSNIVYGEIYSIPFNFTQV